MDDLNAGRILLVVPEGTDDFTASLLQKLDHSVTTCNGPHPGSDCPLLRGHHCDWFDEAHGIVFALDLSVPSHREIVQSYAEMAAAAGRDLPMRVVVPPGTSVPPGIDLPTWSGEPTVADLDGFAALVEATDRAT